MDFWLLEADKGQKSQANLKILNKTRFIYSKFIPNIFFLFPKFLELFLTPKKTPPKVKKLKMGLNRIFFGTPCRLCWEDHYLRRIIQSISERFQINNSWVASMSTYKKNKQRLSQQKSTQQGCRNCGYSTHQSYYELPLNKKKDCKANILW